MKRLFFATIFVALALASCQSELPTPAPADTETAAPTSESRRVPTAAPTPRPTFTRTPQPTVTPELPTATVTPAPNEVWVNAPDGLILRTAASATASWVILLKFGQHLVMLESKVGPDASGFTWQNVDTDDGKIGWVSAEYLSRTNPVAATPVAAPVITTTSAITSAVATTSTTTSDVWVTAANGLNLRAQATVASTLIATLSFGQHLAAIGSKTVSDANGIVWQNVRTDDGKAGWVAADFLSSTQPTLTPTPTIKPTTTVTP